MCRVRVRDHHLIVTAVIAVAEPAEAHQLLALAWLQQLHVPWLILHTLHGRHI